MRRFSFVLCFLLFASICSAAFNKNSSNYVVLMSEQVANDAEWRIVATTLQKRHRAALLTFTNSPKDVLNELRDLAPRYVAIVEKPEVLNRDYVIGLHKISRMMDQDIYADFLWGIITGYDAMGAMRMVKNSDEPFVIESAVATITELRSGKWFSRFAWIDDHTPGRWGEKNTPKEPMSDLMIEPKQVLQKFYDIYATYDPDLIVTAAHATEKNLEMPYSLGNIKSQEGKLYAAFPNDPRFLEQSGKRRVYFAVGNCLIGNVNNTKESMAIAWMNSANAATMIGYVVTTWHGRNGWGGLKYWLTNSGNYSLAEAIYMNQQDLLTQLYEWSPKLLEIDYPHNIESFGNALTEGERRIIDSAGITKPTNDQLGFLHDRDVLAYYGDPKWDIRLQQIDKESDYTVTTTKKGKKVIVTIKTNENFNLERMKGDHFKEEHVLDLPFSYFFPERLKNPRLASQQSWKVAVDENFLLVYDPDFQPNHSYRIELMTD